MILSDDSPEDGEGGAALFSHDVRIISRDFDTGKKTAYSLQEVVRPGSEWPVIFGGFRRPGFLAADGSEEIKLRFDLLDPTYSGPAPNAISRIGLELVVANDYLIEVSSDLQSDLFLRQVFIPVFRADGNVKDSSNQRVLAFNYGLPTANQIVGFTFELTDLEGFNGNFELNVNNRWHKFPNPNLEKHHVSSQDAISWMGNLSKVSHPYFGFGEAFFVAPDYQTSFRTVQETGIVDYGDDLKIYEFVDDNDDQDRQPDWRRRGNSNGDTAVFPGWDENNDFISDYNQNDNAESPNRFPDYEEPFLRFHTDRPEFLYGIDMNHNGTIDRFENDEEADLPYKRDRKGYNIYLGRYLHPQLKLTLGQQRARQIADERRNLASYLLLSGDHTISRFRLRLFQDLRKVEDTIRNDLLQWVQPPNSRGELRPVRDVLPARNTVINTTWLGLDYDAGSALKIKNVLRWQHYHQLDSSKQLALRTMREQTSFFGVINKAEYRLQLGKLSLSPAWKSEFRREAPVLLNQPERKELSQILLVVARFPVMLSSYLEAGVEYHDFRQLRDPTPPGGEDSFWETTTVAQLTNVSDYQGYKLTTVLGFDITRRYQEVEGTRTRTRGFLTVYAGVEQ